MGRTMTGGCQCGRIRYEAVLAEPHAYLCHCSLCRRATGGPFAAFVNLPKADVGWTARPDSYRSSPIGRRGFCAACGTPLAFDYPDSDRIDLLVGSFDDPGLLAPTHHFAIEQRLPAWSDTSALHGERLDENAELQARWSNADGDRHPA